MTNPDGRTDGPDEAREEKPVVRDNRRIDPETGRVREAPAGGTDPAPAGVDETHAAQAAEYGTEDVNQVGEQDQEPHEGPAYADEAPESESLADLKAENARLADELARSRAAQYNTEQEYGNFVRRSRESAAQARRDGASDVVEALFGVLDEIALARQHGDLTGTFATMATKLENTLEQRFNVVRFGEVGEEFDPELHEALMATPSEDVAVATIAQVMQPGYRIDETVLRPARVAVNNPQ